MIKLLWHQSNELVQLVSELGNGFVCPINAAIKSRCRNILLNCDEFRNFQTITALFAVEELSPFKDRLRDSNRRTELIDFLLDDLFDEYFASGQPVFPMMLSVLSGHYNPGDSMYQEIIVLKDDVTALLPIRLPVKTQVHSPAHESLHPDATVDQSNKALITSLIKAIQEQVSSLLSLFNSPLIYPSECIDTIQCLQRLWNDQIRGLLLLLNQFPAPLPASLLSLRSQLRVDQFKIHERILRLIDMLTAYRIIALDSSKDNHRSKIKIQNELNELARDLAILHD